MSEYHRKRTRWDLISAAGALALAVGGAAYGIAHNVSRSDDTAPQPATVTVVKSPLATELQINDCPTEDTMDAICVWDAAFRGNGQGQSFVLVFGETFKVGRNDDGTIWVDYNHDGEEGYPDA